MFYSLQNASFMHISLAVNAIEDVYFTLGHFVKNKMADSRFNMEMPYFFRFALFVCFFEGSYPHFSENGWYKVHICHFFNILITKGDVSGGYQNTLVTNLAIIMFHNLQNASFMYISSPVNVML